MANQFKRLRCPEDQMKPTYTVAELEEANIGGHSAIYKYESGESKPGYDALKAYKHLFKCSYEYLFDEVPLPSERHKYITDKSLLSNFNTTTIDNLEHMLTDTEYANFNAYMFNAFLTDSASLQNIMDITFRFMHKLNQIYENSSLRQGEKELQASHLWYSLNQHIDTYLRDTLMPNLESGFKKYETKNEERKVEAEKREMEAGKRAVEQYEEYQKQQEYDSKITVTVQKPVNINNMQEEKG